MKKKIAVLLFPRVELLDFAGPLETLVVAKRVDGGDCFTVSPTRDVVTEPSQLRVTADYIFDDAPAADVLVVPGGKGASEKHPHTEETVEYIRAAARRGATIASVCTGTFLLGWAGLLDGRHCTTHHRYREQLAVEFPRATVERATVVADGADLVTAANVSSGIDLSIYLARRFFGHEIAERIAVGINFATRQNEIMEFGAVPTEAAPARLS